MTGEIVIEAEVPPFKGGIAHVRLEDVSRADGKAVVIAESTIRGVEHPGAGGVTRLPFALRAAPGLHAPARQDAFAVRVWVDKVGDGRQRADDLYSDRSHRVLTGGFGRTVDVSLGPRRSG